MPASLGYVIFYVPDVAEALRFYSTAFEFEVRMATPEGDYGELHTGQTTLAFVSNELAETNLHEAGGFRPLDPAAPPMAATITLVTEDVMTTMDAALTAGARPYTEPVEKPWGQTVAYLIDPQGILIEVATPVASG